MAARTAAKGQARRQVVRAAHRYRSGLGTTGLSWVRSPKPKSSTERRIGTGMSEGFVICEDGFAIATRRARSEVEARPAQPRRGASDHSDDARSGQSRALYHRLAAAGGNPSSAYDNRRIHEQLDAADDGDRLCTEASVHWRRLMQTLTCDTLRYP